MRHLRTRIRSAAPRFLAGLLAVAHVLVGIGLPVPPRASADRNVPKPCETGPCCCAASVLPGCGCGKSKNQTCSRDAKRSTVPTCCSKPKPPTEPRLTFVPAWVPTGCQGQSHGPAGLLTAEPAIPPGEACLVLSTPSAPPRFARFDLASESVPTPPTDPPPRRV